MNRPWIERESVVSNNALELGITVTLPQGETEFPAVILCGGSMSHLRDGDLFLDGHRIRRKAIQHLSHCLASRGIASIRWDKPGFGLSRIISGRPAENTDYIDALDLARNHMAGIPGADKNRIIVAGESAGAYYACRWAQKYGQAFAYMILGGLGSSTKALFEFNYKRTLDYAKQSDQTFDWVVQKGLRALAVGLNYETMFRQAKLGSKVYHMHYKGQVWDWYLPPLREQIEQDLLSLYANLKRPVLVIQGENDMNVPPGDAAMIARFIRQQGNPDVAKVIVPQADHNFQKTPNDYEQRLRERISLACLENPYQEAFYREVTSWCHLVLGQ